MKNKIVIWGENEKLEKVLLALELLERDNKVLIYVFPETIATEEFYNSLMNDWKDDKDVTFPAQHTVIERPLSVSDSLLPDSIKTDKSDILSRAQAEWHFIVLSSKLYEMYKNELDELKDKIDSLSEYKEEMWTEMKNFWSKVQEQANEKNIFRDQTATLKERTNNLFDKLKSLRKELRKDIESKSSEIANALNDELEAISEKIEKGLALNPIFDELKQLQDKFFKEDLVKKDKDKVWAKLDSLFKSVKEKRFGEKKSSKGNNNSLNKITSRLDGLEKAIQRMQKSIDYDRKDIEFQNSKISSTDGQLEMQIRQAKLVMIEERLNSKSAKLEDMLKTKKDLIHQIEKEKQKEAQKQIDADKSKAKEIVKQKIKNEIATTHEQIDLPPDELEKAADQINASRKKKVTEVKSAPEDSDIIEDVLEKVSQIAEDVSDTIAATIDVVEDKVEEFIDRLTGDDQEEE